MKRIIPFSNSTEAMIWISNNCDVCKTKNNCSAKKNIELGFVTGDISIKTAEFIGFHNNKINSICNFKDKRAIRKNIKIDNNSKLF